MFITVDFLIGLACVVLKLIAEFFLDVLLSGRFILTLEARGILALVNVVFAFGVDNRWQVRSIILTGFF